MTNERCPVCGDIGAPPPFGERGCNRCHLYFAFWPDLRKRLAIIDDLEKTEDGVPITPKTALWQIDLEFGMVNDGHPWPCGPGWTFQRVSRQPVYSTKEAALAAIPLDTQKKSW